MNERKLTDLYEDLVEESFEDVQLMSSEYREGYYDGAYAFFAKLLGEPSA